MLSLQLLGTPLIRLETQAITHFRSAKSLALLVYLAMERGTPHSRASLMTLLWPDQPEENGRQNLSQTLTRLRGALGPAGDMVMANRQAVWLDERAQIDLDVHTFWRLLAEVDRHNHENRTNCAVCQGKLSHAAALVRGELLAGVTVDDSYLFEEWLLLERERVHERLLGVLSDLAEGALYERHYEVAIQYARRQVALEAWRESAHRQLIQALALSGQRSAALAQYEHCRTVLAQELGVEPTRVTQQLAAAVRADTLTDSPPVPPAPPNHNLPNRLTPFVGREAEITTLLAWLTQDESVRLISLTGPGGIGKTSLAQEVGRCLLTQPVRGQPLEGVWFISLIGIQAAENVPVAIANALDLPLPSQDAAATAVIQQLRQRRFLLILDNFEQVVESRAWLLELLQGASGIRLIVTSRERLRLMVEHRFDLHGLATPAENTVHTQALDYDASRLFLDRARRLYREFRLTEANWLPIVRICRLTEGLPLGIELAVTLLEDSDPETVARRITQDAAALTADYLDIAPHQRSIQLVFEQSWGRLSSAEQSTLSRLSIFESEGFSRAAALHVANTEWRTLGALVRKSLVRSSEADIYALHPLYKALAARKLPTDQTDLRHAHADYFAHLLAEAVPPVFDKQKHLQLRSLLPLLPDFRASWHWSIEIADASLIGRLAGPLYRLLRETAQLQEGRALFETAWQTLQTRWPLASRPLEQEKVMAEMSAQLGIFRVFTGDVHTARPALELALTEFDRLHMLELRGGALTALSDVLERLGEYDAWLILWQAELTRAEAGNDLLHLNRTLGNLGTTYYHMRQLEEARDIYRRTVETAFAAEVPDYDNAITMNNLGLAEMELGNLAQARLWLEKSLQIRRQYANTYRIAAALRGLGLLAMEEGDYAAAQEHLNEAMAYFKQSGRVDRLAPAHLALGQLALRRGDLPTAERQIRQALAYTAELQQTAQGLKALWHWAEYLWAAGRESEARPLLAYLLGHKNTSGLLARMINEFLAARQVSIQPSATSEAVAWQSWL
ncbi:MAG: tetratricopeptide repeat protein [Chloroflexi bacterium]|nr:tetratricopeptide repeat protein [Chloroflexota bacterium]